MTKADIVIIGAGAAGLMAAKGAAETLGGKGKVIVLEKMPRPARKIMITGKGRCNFTNLKDWNEFSTHLHPKPGFLKPAFHNLTAQKLIDMMQEMGMESTVERGDRVFPTSHLASGVVDTLVRAAEHAGAKIVCSKETESLCRKEDGFEIRCTDGGLYSCRKVVICTGGLSYPKTGSSGDGYAWAKGFGHTIKPLLPSLTAIVPQGYKDMTQAVKPELKGHIDRSTPLSEFGHSLQGIQLKNIGLSVEIDGNIAQSEFGDIDFTDGGLEGPVGFKISRKCVCAIANGSKVRLSLDLKPAVELQQLYNRIIGLWENISNDRKSAKYPYKDRLKLLISKLMPTQLCTAFMKMHPNIDHRSLAKALKDWKMQAEGYVGYERCVVTSGGVCTEEITPKTLESRIIPGLYMAGEILDIDADTGGYNLHTAFSTGLLAGINAAKSLA